MPLEGYTVSVYTLNVRNITLSAEGHLIEHARLRAAQEKKTLNQAFREWLARYAGVEMHHQEYEQLMNRLQHVRSGRTFSRYELNQR